MGVTRPEPSTSGNPARPSERGSGPPPEWVDMSGLPDGVEVRRIYGGWQAQRMVPTLDWSYVHPSESEMRVRVWRPLRLWAVAVVERNLRRTTARRDRRLGKGDYEWHR